MFANQQFSCFSFRVSDIRKDTDNQELMSLCEYNCKFEHLYNIVVNDAAH